MGRAGLRSVTRQTWTSLVAAACFVTLAALIAVLPVPYVTWSPGGTHDALGTVDDDRNGTTPGTPMIAITGTATYPTTGRLDLTTVSVTSARARLSLPEAVAAYWLPNRDALPRDSVYAPGKTPDQLAGEASESMDTSQDNAVVAALRAAGQPVREMPVVSAVTIGAPAHNLLQPGDLIVSVGGVPVERIDDVGAQIRRHEVDEPVEFVVLRDRAETRVTVTLASSAGQAGVPVVGITVAIGYAYQPEVSFDVGRIGESSAGLVFALAVYDKITPGPLLAGAHLAGTGTITPTGEVGAIGGVAQKIAGAERAGAAAFLLPAANCKDLDGVRTSLEVIKVATLEQAIGAVQQFGTAGQAAALPRC